MTAVVTVTRRIAASADRLFDAWLDPEALAVWMRREGGEATTALTDPRVGGDFTITMRDAAGTVVHSGTYTVIDRPRTLEFTWRSHATHRVDSIVRVSFEPDGDATRVEVRHERLPDAEAVRLHTEGWTEIMSRFAGLYTEGEAA
ncbi:SRPBCC family protein [Agromyces allii]|uniref:SRPBCC domain-containing protein n=1 Tax=Agromyces allii TaxID=393607 RepID=A0ABP5CH24_9MICO|nr:SRPBCC domain-containing protein [Agromyces allii]